MAEKPQRTFVLWCLGLCTLIDVGMDILGYLNFALFPKMMQQSIELVKKMPAFSGEEVAKAFDAYLAIPQWQFILLIIADIAIFVGALIMLWKLKQIGFHIYTIGQICFCCIIYFIIGKPFATGASGILWIMMLIVLFATQLRYMTPIGEKEQAEDIPDPWEENDHPDEEQPTD